MRTVVNFLGFQAGWWACILGAAAGQHWTGPAVVGVVLVVHLALRPNRLGELALVFLAALLGLMLDGTLAANGLLRFPDYDGPMAGPLPLWMLALWVNFAPTLGSSLAWLRRRWLLGALFGLVGGPLTYWAGARLEALELGSDPGRSLLGVALVWVAAMPLLAIATERALGPPPVAA